MGAFTRARPCRREGRPRERCSPCSLSWKLVKTRRADMLSGGQQQMLDHPRRGGAHGPAQAPAPWMSRRWKPRPQIVVQIFNVIRELNQRRGFAYCWSNRTLAWLSRSRTAATSSKPAASLAPLTRPTMLLNDPRIRARIWVNSVFPPPYLNCPRVLRGELSRAVASSTCLSRERVWVDRIGVKCRLEPGGVKAGRSLHRRLEERSASSRSRKLCRLGHHRSTGFSTHFPIPRIRGETCGDFL